MVSWRPPTNTLRGKVIGVTRTRARKGREGNGVGDWKAVGSQSIIYGHPHVSCDLVTEKGGWDIESRVQSRRELLVETERY